MSRAIPAGPLCRGQRERVSARSSLKSAERRITNRLDRRRRRAWNRFRIGRGRAEGVHSSRGPHQIASPFSHSSSRVLFWPYPSFKSGDLTSLRRELIRLLTRWRVSPKARCGGSAEVTEGVRARTPRGTKVQSAQGFLFLRLTRLYPFLFRQGRAVSQSGSGVANPATGREKTTTRGRRGLGHGSLLGAQYGSRFGTPKSLQPTETVLPPSSRHKNLAHRG